LFSDPASFVEAYPDRPRAISTVTAIRAQFPSPEHIDDDPLTAPSKRIQGLLPDYQKPVARLLIAQRIGLAKMRSECHHFGDWITRLLALDDPTMAS